MISLDDHFRNFSTSLIMVVETGTYFSNFRADDFVYVIEYVVPNNFEDFEKLENKYRERSFLSNKGISGTNRLRKQMQVRKRHY